MKNPKQKAKAVAVVDRLLESRAVQFVANNQTTMVVMTWLALRAWQLLFLIPNQDVQRYFITSGQWLAGQAPYRDFLLEYPPGALILFALPRLLTDDFMRYSNLFAGEMLLVDAAILFFMWRLPQRIFGTTNNDVGRRYDTTVAMMAYIAFTAVLGALAFERYDLVCALLFLGWLDFAMDRANRWVADALMAVGIWVKLIPVLFLPIYLMYVLVCVARDKPDQAPSGSVIKPAHFKAPLLSLSSIVGITAVLFGIFYGKSGSALWNFIDYHKNRGIQLEATYSSVLLWLHDWFGVAVRTQYTNGCTEIAGDAADAIAFLPPLCTGAAIAAISAWFMLRLYRAGDQKERNFALFDGTLAVLIAFIFFNKVFSPQYLLWIAPLAGLVTLRDHARTRQWLLGFTVTFLLTALILLFYYRDTIMMDALPVCMLVTRNLLMGCLMIATMRLPTPAWGQRLLDRSTPWLRHPGWAYLALALVVTWAFVANLSETTANDIWIQLRSGEDIIKSGALPDKEVYSATVLGRDFIAHEWLSGVIFYGLVAAFGGAGLSFLAAFVAIATLALLYFTQPPQQRQTLHYLLLLILAIYLVSFRVLVRPHIFTIVAQAALLLALERWRRNGELRELLWLIPMQLVWVNLHGAALFGPGLLFVLAGVVLVMVWLPVLQGKAEVRAFAMKDVYHLGGMAVALTLACLLNPYGIKIITFSIDLLNNDYAKSRVWEWTTPFMQSNMSYYWLWLFVGALVMLWASLLVRLSQKPVIDFVLAAIVTFLSVRANRFVPDLAIFAFPVIARSMYYIEQFSLKEELRVRRPWAELAVITLLLTQAVTYGYAHSAREHRPQVGWGFGGDMPYQEVDLIKKMKLKGTIYNEYSDGALIIHELVPDVRPVLDSRIDLYPIETVSEYDNAYVNPDLFRKYIRDHKVNLVLLYRGRAHPAVLNYLASDANWRLLSTTNGRVLYMRRNNPASTDTANADSLALPDTFRPGGLPASKFGGQRPN